MRRAGLVGGLLAALALAACQRQSDSGDVKRMPESPPPEHIEVPASLSIPVEVDGVAAAPIDAAMLRAHPPDFADAERRAWKLVSLLGAPAEREHVTIEAVGKSGVAIAMPRPKQPTDPVPVLALTRRGEVAAAMVAPDDPFPEYHGRGGRLRRPGDPLPRVMPVAQVRVLMESAGSGQRRASDAGALAGVTVMVGGQAAPAWSTERVAKVATLAMETEGGMQQDAWSLRDLVHELVGAQAHATLLRDQDGKTVAIDDAAWADAGRTPVLRTNRRGLVKFQWVDAKGTADADGALRGVTAIEIAP